MPAVGIDDPRDVAADRAEVAPLHVGVDIDHAADVVVVDRRHLLRARDGGDVGQDRRPRSRGSGDRDVLQIVQRLDVVLRRLGRDVVVHAVLPVQEEQRRGLETAAQRVQHAARDVALGQTVLLRLGAVDIDLEVRVVELLLDARVDHAGHRAHLVEDLVGDDAVAGDVGAVDLDVDRRRHAEVQDLRDDVGRQEVERHAGKSARQVAADRRDVIRGRPVIGLERDHDVGVRGADGARGRVRQVDGAVGQADVVEDRVHLARRDDLPDGGFDQVGEPRGLLDAGAGLGAHVQDELAAVGVGEEVLAEPGHQPAAATTAQQEARDEDGRRCTSRVSVPR